MCESIARCLLIILNSVIAVIGIAFAIFGGLLAWNKPLIEKLVQEGLKALDKAVPQMDQAKIEEVINEILKIASPVGIGIFIFGMILVGVSVLGFIGVCCHVRVALFVYAALFGVLVLAHLILVIIYYAKKDLVKAKVNEILQNLVHDYKSLSSQDVKSLMLGVLMPSMKCCGYNSGEDFKTTGNFQKIEYVNGVEIQVKYPVPCCIEISTAQGACPRQFNAQNSYIYVGCKGPWNEMVVSKLDIIVGFSFIVMGINIAIVVLAIIAK